MKKVVLKAYGKVNLGLDVVRRRDDGYHEVRMIMQTVGLFDRLELKKTSGDSVTLSANLRFLPVNEQNLVCQAIAAVKKKYSIKSGVEAYLEKRIPIAAGMAGGSSDCAAALRGMNQLFELGLKEEELCEIGAGLGADVPYCVIGGTALAEGIGEKLTKLPPVSDCHILIAKPGISVSTKTVYENLDVPGLSSHPDITGMISAIENQDLKGITGRMENVLETVTIPRYPVIDEIKEFLLKQGAENALMSGSGPTVFGIFASQEKAQRALSNLRSFEDVKQAYVVAPVNRES